MQHVYLLSVKINTRAACAQNANLCLDILSCPVVNKMDKVWGAEAGISEDWAATPDLCVCSVSIHDIVPTMECPFFLITSTPDGRHVINATWPAIGSSSSFPFPTLSVSQDTDMLSKYLFPVLHHTAPFRIYANITSTGAPCAYRLKSVKRDVDLAVVNGTEIVKELELVAALCNLKKELYYAAASTTPPQPLTLPATVEAMLVDVDADIAASCRHTPPQQQQPPPPCEGWIRPLRVEQRGALEWMHRLERSETPPLVLDTRVPISDSVAVDLHRQTLVCARTPPVPTTPVVELTVGVLTGGRGCGKTAVAIALAFSSEPPQSPLTPYEVMHLTPCPSTTLVIVPRHLISCWKTEIRACFPAAPALFMSSAREARTITVAQVMSSRLVVITDTLVASMTATFANETPAALRTRRTTAAHTPGSTAVALHGIKWGRIVVDEALRKNTLAHSKLRANWWWCICADAEKMHPYKLLQKLEFATQVAASSTWALSLTARSQFVTRYMHVLQEPERPADSWSDRVVWVELRPDEYMRYEAARAENWSDERLIKLCCGTSQDHPGGFVAPQPLCDIVTVVESLHTSIIRALHAMDPSDAHVADVLRDESGSFSHFDKVMRELLQEQTDQQQQQQAAAAAAAGGGAGDQVALAAVQQQQRQCPLCMEEPFTVVTTCGHTYCWTCMFRTFHGASTTPCPYCRRMLSPGDVYQVSRGGGLDPPTGQKSVALIAMLSALVLNTSDNAVVYVAWPGMAHQLAALMESSGITARAMGGRGVESALRAFEAREARVLVVAYDHGEGLTLVCANHVVIYHATSGRNNDIAMSSVNRTGQTKPIHVYRFIAQGTLETTTTTQTPTPTSSQQ